MTSVELRFYFGFWDTPNGPVPCGCTVIDRFALDCWFAASSNCTVNVDVFAFMDPVVVGVPEIEPVLLIRKPAGSEPAVIVQVYGG